MRKLFLSAVLVAASASAAELTGVWGCTVESDMGSGTPTFDLKQEGTTVKGTYSGALGEAPVTGSVAGSNFEISFAFDQGKVTYKGEQLPADGTLKGTIDFAGQATGTFNCKKKKS
ncbi:hypothetical protein F183_A22230 [Bryobacterales bacterium F-183]|nr:hypothetical protein F183_A22230 [Bryobacterales bacterium F-183]